MPDAGKSSFPEAGCCSYTEMPQVTQRLRSHSSCSSFDTLRWCGEATGNADSISGHHVSGDDDAFFGHRSTYSRVVS